MNSVECYIQEEHKGELQYWLSGDYESFCNKKKEIYMKAKKSKFGKEKQEHICGMYHNELKYSGDLELAFLIEKEEKKVRNVRKQLSKQEYSEQLLNLIHLRNQYAKTAGFENYLDYKYDLWGIEYDILNKVAVKQQVMKKNDITCLEERFIKILRNALFDVKNQTFLLKQVDECWNLNLRDIHIHDKNLPGFYIGACVPISIPDDIHVLINKQPGLSGFSVFMHEIGHAYYYKNMISEDSYGKKIPFNLIIEETVALLFENQVFSEKFIARFLDIEMDMWSWKANMQLNYLLCCTKFEESIYKKSVIDFDKEWENACVFMGKHEKEGWIKPHFFVSNPGYFAAYYIAAFLAREIYLQIDREGQDLICFIKNDICSIGTKIQYNKLLDKILLVN